jgi:ankyrin repeat protein
VHITFTVNGHEKVPPSLFHSISKQDSRGVEEYITAGYDTNVADALGEPAVNQAARLGNASMVKALVEAGANPNHGSFNGGDTALMQAASQGHLR